MWFLALALIVFALPSYAQETFGLSMHGVPKYTAQSKNLDYTNPDAPNGGILKQSAVGTFDTVNIFSIKGKAAEGLDLIYDRLMVRVWDEPFSLYPNIAKSADIPEDRSSITFTLNENAKFYDGSPVRAEDVLFSFETLKEKGRPNQRRIYKLVKDVEKLSSDTIKFTFGEGYDRETAMIIAMMPVLSKTYWEKRDFEETTLDIPLSNGPYKIKSIDPGRKITLERVHNYWAKNQFPHNGLYNFDELVFEYYRDNTVALEAFKKGNLNIRREWDPGRWYRAYNLPDEFVKEELDHGRPDRVRSFIFNTRRPPFDDIRVRKALNLVFDFDWVNQNLFFGQYKQINSFFPNTDLGYEDKEASPISMREKLRQADALLKEAGWNINNGKRIHENGENFSFEILLDNPSQEKIALAFIRNLERLGIEARVRVLDSAAFRGRLNDYDFDMILYYWLSTLSPGTEQYLYWSCEAAEQPARWNFAGICDPEIDQLAKDIANTISREDLKDKTKALDKRLLEGHYMIPLYYNPKDYVAYHNSIKRPDRTPLYGMVIESWWMDDTQSVEQ